jgi:hypothetical protein
MIGSYWRKTTYLTLGDALKHLDNTLPSQAGVCCKREDDGFVCTLFEGHSGSHEAWAGSTLHHTWPNTQSTEVH